MPLQITITDAGRAEIINAENTGTGPVVITEIGFGTGQYAPSKTQPALQAEVKRLGSIAGQAVAADTIHVMAKDEGPDAYNVGEFGLFSSAGTLIAVYSQPAASGWIIQKSGASTLLLATDIILESLDATSLTFGDILFINPPATTEVQGVVELATDVETQDGLDGVRAVTPAGLKSLTASLVRAGLVQLVNTLTSSSQSMALTAAMGKKLQDEKQPLDATLTALAGLVTAANQMIYSTGADSFAMTSLSAFARTLLDDADAAAARTTLGAQPLDATLTALAGLVTAANQLIYSTGADTFAMTTLSAFARTLLDDADAAAARTTLGAQPLDATLTALAGVVTAANKLIYATGADTFATTDLTAFARGLLGDATAADARTTLGAQPLDATLTALAGLVTAANQMIYSTGADTFAMTALSAFARTLLDDADAATARTTLGAQPLDATLTALAGVVTAANKLIYATGADTFATTDLTAFARGLLGDASATEARTTLGMADAVVVKSNNANGSYRVWSSGLKEMWLGAVTLTPPYVLLNLPIALSSLAGANGRATILGAGGFTSTLTVDFPNTSQIRVYCSQNCNVMIQVAGDFV
ncbi:phage tail protein [Pseudomonas aeruginosa]|uniref:phage tail-collar fiber domain-containing protein n=1 Tax=Pseudomonas aeruginosa TaxID=287 RepID=UPI00244A38F1|nr:phage tail protein [Pseudomonas aeruginosa]MDH0373895.1 phage tail protein [Pseudomonas aeruginosa]